MTYDFDVVIDRRDTNATKLQKYAGSDILPFWIADMDFAVPDFILEPLRERLNHPIIGWRFTTPFNAGWCTTTVGRFPKSGLFGCPAWCRG